MARDTRKLESVFYADPRNPGSYWSGPNLQMDPRISVRKRCGTKGCCKKREVTVETVEKVEEEIEPFDLRGTVYITGGGNCFHRYSNCHSLKFAKVQKREPCSFCERDFAKVQGTAAFLMKHRAEKDKEPESRVAHTERKQD